MLNCKTKSEPKKIESERVVIFSGSNRSGYNHHASVCFYKGKYYTAWSSSIMHEDDCGQQIMMSVSDNFTDWSKPFPIVKTMRGRHSDAVLLTGGMAVLEGVLTLYYGYYEYAKEDLRENCTLRPLAENDHYHLDTGAGFISTEDGIKWSKPQFLDLPAVPNHAPAALKSGRLLIPSSIMFPYTDDPKGITDFKYSGIYGDSFGDEKPYDDSVSIIKVAKNMGWNVPLLCEGSFFQTYDEVIYMVLRSNTKYLWCTESRDNAESWSSPYQTEFLDDGSKFHFGRLPDGRYYYVGNCAGLGNRLPLMLCVSEDGVNFDKQYILRDEPYEKKFSGLYKGGVYGYPVSFADDTYLNVIYSKHKETIEITRVKLSDL